MVINKRLLTDKEIDRLFHYGLSNFRILETIAEAQDEKTAKILLPPLGVLAYRVQSLVDHMDRLGLLDEHSFTFSDGETWEATKEQREV